MRGTPRGDVYFDVLYPDPQTAARESVHWATANGRTYVEGDKTFCRPYPDHLFSTVLAIERTLVGCSGRAEVYALYDSEHVELFFLLRRAAFEVLGLAEFTESEAGQAAWQNAFTLTRNALIALREDRAGLLKETLYMIQGACGRALEEFGVKPDYISQDNPDDLDPVIEALEEADPTAAHSPA